MSDIRSFSVTSYELKKEIKELNEKIKMLELSGQEKDKQISSYQNELNKMLNSKSWKVTKPLRTITTKISELKTKEEIDLENINVEKIFDNKNYYKNLSPYTSEYQDNIDFSNKNILILGKGSKERLVSFGDYALEYINLYLKEGRKLLLDGVKSDYLIVGKKSEKLTTRRVEQIIDDIIKRTSIKLNITPHMFRHTFATHLLDNGCDLLVVQELLGHASLSSTEIYTHVSNEHLRKVYLKCHPRNKR